MGKRPTTEATPQSSGRPAKRIRQEDEEEEEDDDEDQGEAGRSHQRSFLDTGSSLLSLGSVSSPMITNPSFSSADVSGAGAAVDPHHSNRLAGLRMILDAGAPATSSSLSAGAWQYFLGMASILLEEETKK